MYFNLSSMPKLHPFRDKMTLSVQYLETALCSTGTLHITVHVVHKVHSAESRSQKVRCHLLQVVYDYYHKGSWAPFCLFQWSATYTAQARLNSVVSTKPFPSSLPPFPFTLHMPNCGLSPNDRLWNVSCMSEYERLLKGREYF